LKNYAQPLATSVLAAKRAMTHIALKNNAHPLVSMLRVLPGVV